MTPAQLKALQATMGKMMANIIKARLEYHYDLERHLGESEYQKGKKEGMMLVLQDICDFLHAEGILEAKTFIRECVPA